MGNNDIENLKILVGFGFGGILSIATIILFHLGIYLWGILCFGGVFLSWLLDNEKSCPIISAIFLIGGFAEILIFQNIFGGIVAILIACVSYFLPKLV
jgi:hypothetical protein